MTLRAGARLGPYEILSPLGAGGMGEVYRAKDTRLDRDVAVKVVPETLSADPEARGRFEREAKAVAALSHPNILALFDVGEEGGVHFAVSELLEGETLRAALGHGALPLRKGLEIAREIAEGLAAAHDKGIVHRDVKPENVFLTKDGHAKVLDFGLARHDVAHREPSDTRSPTLGVMSEKGVVLGTVAYMSPEQARGSAVDFRSDQFSLGSVLYELLSGAKPFEAASATETLAAIIRDEPEPLEKKAPNAPAPVRWLVERLLSKDPSERYESTRDLARDLRSIRDHLTTTAVQAAAGAPGRPRAARRVSLVAAGVLLLALGAVVGRRTAPPAPAAVPAEVHDLLGTGLQPGRLAGPKALRLRFIPRWHSAHLAEAALGRVRSRPHRGPGHRSALHARLDGSPLLSRRRGRIGPLPDLDSGRPAPANPGRRGRGRHLL